MSRAVNVSTAPAEVASLCQKKSIAISAIEGLVSGGTRVVFMNMTDTATMKQAFGSKVLTGAVSRVPLRFRGQ